MCKTIPVVAAVTRRHVLFALVLVPAVLTRENSLVLVPFLGLLELRHRGVVRTAVLVALVAVPGVVAFELARWFPLFPPPPGFEDWVGRYRFDVNIRYVLDNVDGSLWRYVLAAPITLGVFAAIPLARLRGSVAFLWRELAWAHYIFASLGLSLLGGRDDGRYAYLLLPAAAVLTFAAASPRQWRPPFAVLVVLTITHLASTLYFRPLGPGEPDYLEYTVAFMTGDHLRAAGVLAAAVFVAVLAVLHRARLIAANGAIAARAGRSGG